MLFFGHKEFGAPCGTVGDNICRICKFSNQEFIGVLMCCIAKARNCKEGFLRFVKNCHCSYIGDNLLLS